MLLLALAIVVVVGFLLVVLFFVGLSESERFK